MKNRLIIYRRIILPILMGIGIGGIVLGAIAINFHYMNHPVNTNEWVTVAEPPPYEIALIIIASILAYEGLRLAWVSFR